MSFAIHKLRGISGRLRAAFVLGGALLLAAAARAEDCGNGVELTLSAPDTAQGTLLLAQVRGVKPLGEVSGKWNDRDIPFWQGGEREHGASGADVRKALLGVDLEKPAGKYEFTVEGQMQSGEPVNCRAMVEVKEGHFATESLTVKKQFVEPNPEQEARAAAETKRLREIYDRVTPERLWDGRFRVPLDGDFKGSNFGKRRVLNGHPGSPHGGVDFPAPTGTPVHAAQKGRVVLAEELFFSGNTVIVDHGLGIYTFYCHFSEIDAKVGEEVVSGTVLGKVGATGRVTGPHLHWGLEVQRARVNALDIVKVL
ncbi:MAG TPA: M23 family metallopeptidase [Candidatus Acidoferrum sp.]|nr:M23 family metallopeptidase [Candidatus Acidoferrum sp.]